MLQIIAAFHRRQLWSQSVPALAVYLKFFRTQEAQVRLWLARILVQAENGPAQALAVLAKLPDALFTEADRQVARQIQALAQHLRAARPGEKVQDW